MYNSLIRTRNSSKEHKKKTPVPLSNMMHQESMDRQIKLPLKLKVIMNEKGSFVNQNMKLLKPPLRVGHS